MEKLSVTFGQKRIPYLLTYNKRKTLGIKVTPDLKVYVIAPDNTPRDKIKKKVKKRAPWIIKQQRFFKEFHPLTPPRKYISGETHYYLGKQYKLKVIKSSDEYVKMRNGYIELHVRLKNNYQSKKEQMNRWYQNHAEVIFNKYLDKVKEKFIKYRLPHYILKSRYMKKKWGYYSLKNEIILNPELIKAPAGCIEYVIIHELCHLVYPDHKNKFINLQDNINPDWKKWKKLLEKFMA